jgi:CRP/FNR family cyclic AMP-dependent transcriptional regulator
MVYNRSMSPINRVQRSELMVDTEAQRIDDLELFSDCTKSERRQISRLTTQLTLPKDRVLMREGGSPKEFIIIGSGQVEVTRATDQGRSVLTELGTGEFLGEMALLRGTLGTATVTAATDLTVFVSSASEFRTILQIAPSVATKVHRTLQSRSESLAA